MHPTLFVAGDPLAGPATPPPPPPGIQFTQHLMPHGRKVPQWIERTAEVEAKAARLAALGYTFHCEMLSDYRTISLTIEAPNDQGDVAIETCPNGPEVLAAVDKLILGFEPR